MVSNTVDHLEKEQGRVTLGLSKLNCGTILNRLRHLRRFARTIWRQTGFANLVEQGAIADAQGAGRLFSVPMVHLQNFEDYLLLKIAHRLPRNFLE